MHQYSENAMKIYRNLYFNPGENNPTDVHLRIAKAIALTPEQENLFFNILEEAAFRPNTPCIINARPKEQSKNLEVHDNNLVACFVLGLEDSMESIMEMWSICAQVYAGGGGTGLPISNLRERNATITSGGNASGPIEYLKVIQTISDTVKSGGKSRRAANLTSFKYNHPDIMEYIDCKKNNNFSAVNISVLMSDDFMTLVQNKDWDAKIDLVSPSKNQIVSQVTVGEIWKKIIRTAWDSGDPGLLFFDAANRTNALPSLGDVVASNPCGEVTLPPFSACDLGSINLNMCLDKDETTGEYSFNWTRFATYIQIATTFLDNVITITSFPHKKFKERMNRERPIGLGMMGFCDILFKMKIRYGSNDSIRLFEDICKFMTKTAFQFSIRRCCENNSCEPINIPKDDYDHFVKRLEYFGVDAEYIDMFAETGIRNSTVTSIAPTGSISITCDCSYAFEPCFALVWSKKLVDRDEELFFTNKDFEDACENAGVKLTPEIITKIKQNKGSCQGIDEIPSNIQNIFVTAHDVGWSGKIQMQAAGQRWITLAISSTCNLPHTATIEDVEQAYLLAWKSGLKGITVFRDGCLSFQPVNFGGIDEKKELTPMKRPIVRTGKTIEVNTPHGKLYMTGNMDKNGNLFEIFINMGQQGHVSNILLDALGKIISKALQYGVPSSALVDTMANCGGLNFFFKLDDSIEKSLQAASIVDAIAKIIDYHFAENKNGLCDLDDEPSLARCPQCKQKTLVMGVGCKGGSCANCGYSSCG